jgi:ADP-L-glycero-D-manno-heptose 6-epimerase
MAPGQQARDFVLGRRRGGGEPLVAGAPAAHSGIFNVGSGRAQPFNDVALAMLNSLPAVRKASGAVGVERAAVPPQLQLRYTAFPEALQGQIPVPHPG